MTTQFPFPPLIDPFDKPSHLTYAQAGRIWPGGKVSPHTVWRWASKGRNGIKLPSAPTKSGGVTTRDAIRWFFAAQQQLRQLPTAPKQQRLQLDPALEAECASAGI